MRTGTGTGTGSTVPLSPEHRVASPQMPSLPFSLVFANNTQNKLLLRPGSPESCGQMQCHSHCLPWTRGGQSTQMGMHRDSGQLASTQRLRHSTQEILVNGQTSMWRTQTRMCPKLTTQLGMSFTRSMNGEAMLLSSTLAPLRRKQKWRH